MGTALRRHDVKTNCPPRPRGCQAGDLFESGSDHGLIEIVLGDDSDWTTGDPDQRIWLVTCIMIDAHDQGFSPAENSVKSRASSENADHPATAGRRFMPQFVLSFIITFFATGRF